MSKHIVYRCDHCRRVLSDDFGDIKTKHLSINFKKYSGWVEESKDRWLHSSTIEGIKQFCGEECLMQFIKENKIGKRNR